MLLNWARVSHFLSTPPNTQAATVWIGRRSLLGKNANIKPPTFATKSPFCCLSVIIEHSKYCVVAESFPPLCTCWLFYILLFNTYILRCPPFLIGKSHQDNHPGIGDPYVDLYFNKWEWEYPNVDHTFSPICNQPRDSVTNLSKPRVNWNQIWVRLIILHQPAFP